MKNFFALLVFLFITSFLLAQNIDAIINAKEAERIERTLSSDDMRGRKVFTEDIDKAADFIATEFRANGLQTWNNKDGYQQEFVLIRPKFISASATLDGISIDQKNIIVVTCQAGTHYIQ